MTFTTEQQAIHQLEVSMTHYRIEGRVIRLAPGESESRVTPKDAEAIAYLCQEWDYDTQI